MSDEHKNNPLHGMTLEKILVAMVDHYGWERLDIMVKVNCFHVNPSIKSCLKFLRKTEWARTKLENYYIKMPKKNQSAE